MCRPGVGGTAANLSYKMLRNAMSRVTIQFADARAAV